MTGVQTCALPISILQFLQIRLFSPPYYVCCLKHNFKFSPYLGSYMYCNPTKSSTKKLKNRLILSHNLYILCLEVNVCRLLMVRGISDSVRKWCHLLYRWGINGIVRKCSPSADVGGDLHNTKFDQRRILQYMEIRQGYSYHIKDEFFDMAQDRYLMSNKENGNYLPHFYAIQDKKNQSLY